MVNLVWIESVSTLLTVSVLFESQEQQRNISNFIQKVYFAHFSIKLGEQDKSWAPHIVCSVCVEELKQGKKKSFRLGGPMILRQTVIFVFVQFKVSIKKKRERHYIHNQHMFGYSLCSSWTWLAYSFTSRYPGQYFRRFKPVT